MKNKKSIILTIILMAVGFAAVSTTLYINGSTNINPNQDDFNVYYSDAYVNGEKDLSVITDDTHIVFTTELSVLGQKYVLDYEVTNASKNYDAELVMECTGDNEYLTVINEFDDDTILEARSTRNGTLTLELTKSNAGEDVEVTIECTIDANAIERTSLNESEIANNSSYVIEGNYVSESGTAIANANLIIFSDTPHYVTTDTDGYLFYNGLEKGEHEIYHVEDTLENIKNMDKEEIKNKAVSSAIFETNTINEIVFDNDNRIANSKIELEDNYCSSLIGTKEEFNYTGSEQTFLTRCDGNYKVELWGAQGGKNITINVIIANQGEGAYTSGNILLEKNEKLYVYVGAQGQDGNQTRATSASFNGGGAGMYASDNNDGGGAGGGATDIRLINGLWNDFESLKSRIMVAAGGGGGATVNHDLTEINSSGVGGGLFGDVNIWYWQQQQDTITNYNAAQTSGYKFGIGADGILSHTGGAGAGGGYYGGNASYIDSSNPTAGGAGGGSSFISGHLGCDAIDENSTSSSIIHTGQANHYSGFIFSDTVMIDGLGYNWTNVKGEYRGMPSPTGTTTIVGNNGHGYARITYLGTN